MRSSRSTSTNFLFIFVICSCVLIYLVISRNYKWENCQSEESTLKKFQDFGNPEEIILNGFRIGDLKNMPPPPPFPGLFPLDMPPPDDRRTLQISMFTAKNGRSLGQILFEMASLYGISQQLGRVPTINRGGGVWDTVTQEVTQHFPVFGAKFEMTDLEDSSAISVNLNIRFCCKFEDPRNLKSIDQQHLLLNGVYFQSFKYFNDFREEIRLALTPHPDSAIRAEILIPEEFRRDFIVCVHTKQLGVKDAGLSKPSDPVFTRRATDYLVKKYNNSEGKRATVAVLGNDPLWAQNVFHDKIGKSNYFNKFNDSADSIVSAENYKVLLTLGLSPIDDIAFSRNFCDAFLLTAPTSSMGWWLAYLAKDGAEVYYRDPREAPDQLFAEMRQPDFYPSVWNKLRSSRFVGHQKADLQNF